jgi:hypothetical protein
MSVNNLYYKKYLKYKDKFLNLQSQIGGSPPLLRQHSKYISCQGNEGTCWAHATTRLFIKLMLTFLSEKLTDFLKELSEIDCNHYYDTTNCSNKETNIFDCFLQIKEGEKNCDSFEGNKKDNSWSEQNFYALLFHFIFSTLVEQFGRKYGTYPETTCLYILDYLKYIKITKYSIAITLGYDSTKYDDSENEYFDKLINDLNEFFKIIKTNLNNKFFDPIIYIYESSYESKIVASISDYHYSSKNFECYANDYEIIDNESLSFKEKYDKKNPFSKKIKNLNPIYKEEHNLKKLINTADLLLTIKHVLNKQYYVLFHTAKHVIIITHYSDSDKGDDTFLHIKNSWGIQSCEETSEWCNLIQGDKISINSLYINTSPYKFIFFYPYTFTKDQNELIKQMNNPKNIQLTFRKDEMNNDEIKAIVYSLIQTTTVTIGLILSDCNIGHIDTIADVLVINTTLQKLNLSHNKIGVNGAKAIADALGKNKTLTELELSHNNISDKGATAIADALEKNETLTELELSHNNISDEGATEIANALLLNKTLKILKLKHNDIGDKGGKEIGITLSGNSTLEILTLNKNKINNDGARLIGFHLGFNTKLQTLELNKNNIDDLGAIAIAFALIKNKNLKILKLNYNTIGNAGADAFALALKENKTLQILTLIHNNIGDKGATSLVNVLEINKELNIQLYLDNNNISNQIKTAIRSNEPRIILNYF